MKNIVNVVGLLSVMLLVACGSSNKLKPSYSNLRKGTYRYSTLDNKNKVIDCLLYTSDAADDRARV